MPIPFTTEDCRLALDVLTYAQGTAAFALSCGRSQAEVGDRLLGLAAEFRERHGLLRCTTTLRQLGSKVEEEATWVLSIAYLPAGDRPLNVVDLILAGSLAGSGSGLPTVFGCRH